MLKYFTVIIFTQAVLCSASAQQKEIDSLQKILPSLQGSARVDCLNDLSKYYCNYLPSSFSGYSRTDSAELYATKAYAEALELKYKFGVGNALLNLGIINTSRLYCPTAQKYFETVIPVFKELKAEAQLNWAYLNLGKVLQFQGNFISGRNRIEEALAYYRSIKDSVNWARAERFIGEGYSRQGYYEEAFEHYQNDFNLTKNFTDPLSVISTLQRKEELFRSAGWSDSFAVYSAQRIAYEKKISSSESDVISEKALKFFIAKKWDSSEYYFKQVYKYINKEYQDSVLKIGAIVRNDMDLASAYQFEGKYKEALPYFMKGLQDAKERNLVPEILEMLLNISQTYHLWGKDEQAIPYIKNLLSLAEKTGTRPYMQEAYELLWEIYDKKKDTAIAYNYYLKSTSLNDSMNSHAFQRKIAVITELTNEKAMKTQLTLLNKDNKIKEAAIQKNLLIRNILIGSIFVILLLGFIVYRIITLKQKNERLEKIHLQYSLDMELIENEKKQSELQNKAAELEMQALRSQMNPHFIFNCLSSINRFILKNKTEEASDYLTKFSRLMRMVLNNSKRPFISLEDELETLRLYLEMERLRFKNSFDYHFIYTNSVDVGNIFIPPLLLQPFAENAIWHGLMHKEERGFVNFIFSTEENLLNCFITDNGVGRQQSDLLKSKSGAEQKSMGLKITTERLSLLNNNSSEQTFFTIEDLTDENKNAIGTCVHLKIYFKEMMEV